MCEEKRMMLIMPCSELILFPGKEVLAMDEAEVDVRSRMSVCSTLSQVERMGEE